MLFTSRAERLEMNIKFAETVERKPTPPEGQCVLAEVGPAFAGLGLFALLQPITHAIHRQNIHEVREPIEQRSAATLNPETRSLNGRLLVTSGGIAS